MHTRRWARITLGSALLAGGAALGRTVARFRDTNRQHAERDRADLERIGMVAGDVEVDGVRVAYAQGPPNGPPLLLVHGQGSQWRDHARVLPELVTRHRVVAVDVPGHGDSGRLPAGGYSLARVGELIGAFAERVIGGPALVSGHSSGGVLGAWLAANRPELVAGLLLEDPPLYSSTHDRIVDTAGGALPEAAAAYLRDGGSGVLGDFQRYYVRHGGYFRVFGPAQGLIIRYATRWLDAHPARALAPSLLPPSITVFFQGVARYDPEFGASWLDGRWYGGTDTDAVLASIGCPVTLLHTNFWVTRFGSYHSKSGMLMAAMDGADVARALDRLPGAELVEVAAGHLVHYDRPRDYLDALAGVAARVSGSGPQR